MKEWFFDTGDPQEAPRRTYISLTFSKEWAHEIDEDSFRDGCSIKLKKNWVVYIAILMEELFNSRLLFFPARDAWVRYTNVCATTGCWLGIVSARKTRTQKPSIQGSERQTT